MKASMQEPNERPHLVALSTAEVIALVRYHTRECKAVVKRYGKASLELSTSVFSKRSAHDQLLKITKGLVEAHGARGKELLAIAKKKS